MSIGSAYKLFVKHATKDSWQQIGPSPKYGGFFNFELSVKEMEAMFVSLGLQTRIEEFQTDYDGRR
jgi:hypothetical protein